MSIFTTTQIDNTLFGKPQPTQPEYGGIPYFELRPYLDSTKLRPPCLQLVLAFNEETNPHSFRLFLGEKYGTRLYTPDTLPDPIMTRFLLARLRTKHFHNKNSSRNEALSRPKGAGRLLVNIARHFPSSEMPAEDKNTGWFLGVFLLGDDVDVYEVYNLILPLPMLDEALGEQIDVDMQKMMRDLQNTEVETKAAQNMSSRSTQQHMEQMTRINKLIKEKEMAEQQRLWSEQMDRFQDMDKSGVHDAARWWSSQLGGLLKK